MQLCGYVNMAINRAKGHRWGPPRDSSRLFVVEFKVGLWSSVWALGHRLVRNIP